MFARIERDTGHVNDRNYLFSVPVLHAVNVPNRIPPHPNGDVMVDNDKSTSAESKYEATRTTLVWSSNDPKTSSSDVQMMNLWVNGLSSNLIYVDLLSSSKPLLESELIRLGSLLSQPDTATRCSHSELSSTPIDSPGAFTFSFPFLVKGLRVLLLSYLYVDP